MNHPLSHYLEQMPLVAILRGITPAESLDVVACLLDAGIRIVEVPLNSPDPFDSIKLIAEKFGTQMLVGAGTVLNAEQVKDVAAAKGRLIVSPNKRTTHWSRLSRQTSTPAILMRTEHCKTNANPINHRWSSK